jgi:flavin reductase like protein
MSMTTRHRKDSTTMRPLPLSRVYQLIEPGPVVLLTTAHKRRANVMTMSWHMMVEFEPPLIACVVSEANFSLAVLRATHEQQVQGARALVSGHMLRRREPARLQRRSYPH